MSPSHLFGPVPSRRLGRSLGVDLIPRKTCPFDCIYCEVGPTSHQTETRFAYAAEAMVAELRAYLEGNPPPLDFITLAGSGEPTLNQGLGSIIRRLKKLTAIPVAVLTNGALLHLPEVRRELLAADLVLPSLDAARDQAFQAVNRPLPGYPLSRLLQGLEAFRREYPGPIWLEVLLLQGLNDSPQDLEALRRALRTLAPDKVQLNTAVRPGVRRQVRPLSAAALAAIAGGLEGEVEVIASYAGAGQAAAAPDDATLAEILARRPMTAADLAGVLGLSLPLVQEKLQRLEQTGQIFCTCYRDQDFYQLVMPRC
jgi:wyosine [tRNA(Phe)-imidazoG37] synthetase (radical SAM superfamily)